MPTFSDTPEWKTREAYEQAKTSPPPKPKRPVITVPCPTCQARAGQPCTGRRGERADHAHPGRLERARRIVRWRQTVQGRRAAAQQRRWATVTVRYECPICGGDHSRADHPSVTGHASVFDFSDNP